jgi:ankyrin repeat protein
LGMAIVNAYYEIAALLLEVGADPNVPDPRGSMLHAVAFMRRPGSGAPPLPSGNIDTLDLARALLAHGANPNARIAWKEIAFDRDLAATKLPPNIPVGRNFLTFIGATPFYLAAKHGDVALMRLLVANGADPRMPTVQGVTPLMAAAGLGFWDGESPGPLTGVADAEAIDVVPPKESLGDMRWTRSTALHGAAMRGANGIVQFLVDHGAKLDAKNTVGWTPLMCAEGIFVANTLKDWPETVALIRKLMTDRGLNPDQHNQASIGVTTTRAAQQQQQQQQQP